MTMAFYVMQTEVIRPRRKIAARMAAQRAAPYQSFLEEIRAYVQLVDEAGFYGRCRPKPPSVHIGAKGTNVNTHCRIGGRFRRTRFGTGRAPVRQLKSAYLMQRVVAGLKLETPGNAAT
jgi:hypothetical protein